MPGAVLRVGTAGQVVPATCLSLRRTPGLWAHPPGPTRPRGSQGRPRPSRARARAPSAAAAPLGATWVLGEVAGHLMRRTKWPSEPGDLRGAPGLRPRAVRQEGARLVGAAGTALGPTRRGGSARGGLDRDCRQGQGVGMQRVGHVLTPERLYDPAAAQHQNPAARSESGR